MKAPQHPDNELERQLALTETGLLDKGDEKRFDRITRIASTLFSVPIALFTLLDRDRQEFKSRHGTEITETERNISFCGHAILKEDPLIIEDTLEDERFFDNPLVTDTPRIRFYAGAPIRDSNGFKLGTLCLIDNAPRSFSSHEATLLTDLAAVIETMIHTDANDRVAQSRHQQALQESRDAYASLVANMPGVAYRCVVEPDRAMLFLSHQINEICGYSAGELINHDGVSFQQLIHPDDYQRVMDSIDDAVNAHRDWQIEYRLKHQGGHWRWVKDRGRTVQQKDSGSLLAEGFIVDITREHEAERRLKDKHRALEVLNTLAINTHPTLDLHMNNALEVARKFLDIETAILSQIEGF